MIKSQHTAKRFSKEAQLTAPVVRFMRTLGYRIITEELPFYEYRIDLYGFSKRNDTTFAVELKLSDWRRALEQAMMYQLCSDHVYVAMPETVALRVDQSQFATSGVGLIGVQTSGGCSLLIHPSQHSETRHFYRQSQIDYLKDYASA